jgi:formate dehydrogenase major subunit
MLRATVNGIPREFAEGQTILLALRSLGIEVPTLCYDPRLKPFAGCRLCVVHVEGHARPLPACDTPLAEGMVIETHSVQLEEDRRTLLTLLADTYSPDALRAFPEKEFHKELRKYGLTDQSRGEMLSQADKSHPYIQSDMSKCILCYRCMRICDELQGQFVWQIWNRGDATRILPDSGTTLRESSCVSCGACVDTCPTGALEDKSRLSGDIPDSWTRTTCPYCGTGCEMQVGAVGGRIVAITPVLDAPVNRGHLCVKGRYAYDFVYATDRVTEPMIRKNDEWQHVSWKEALAFTALALQRTLDLHGPSGVGVLASARATNEENYLAQKFARVVLGTNNVDCCARVCHAPSATALKQTLGMGAATNSFEDIERAKTILIYGANPTENHPIVGARIKQAALHGARLIVVDPREIELARYATVHLSPRPGTNVPLLNALAHTIVEEAIYDRDAIQAWSPERVAPICGVEAEQIRKAARIYATEKPAMSFHGLGLTEHTQGTEGVMCLVNLALLTGNLGHPGTGINPLRGQNNVQGAAQMGCDPDNLTGATPLDTGRTLFENIWHHPLPAAPGRNLMSMIDDALEGRLKALWAIGYDILLTNPNASRTEQALACMDCVIVQDIFLNETARKFGRVFFPACSSFEKDGTFMNAERRIQRVRKAVEPVGKAKPDWEIICALAAAMGKTEYFTFRSPEEIWNEVRDVWKAASGITYPRIENHGLQWPCPSDLHPGTAILHTKIPTADKRPVLKIIEYRETKEVVTAEFPFLLTTGRTLYQFNAGTMTSRTRNSELRLEDFLDISNRDAERLSLRDGDRAQLRSRYGCVVLPVRISNEVRAGELFATFHTPEVFLNLITSAECDGITTTPEYKRTAVQVEKLS